MQTTIDPAGVVSRRQRLQGTQKQCYDPNAQPLPPLKTGDQMNSQLSKGDNWKPAKVIAPGSQTRSYTIQTGDGRTFRATVASYGSSPGRQTVRNSARGNASCSNQTRFILRDLYHQIWTHGEVSKQAKLVEKTPVPTDKHVYTLGGKDPRPALKDRNCSLFLPPLSHPPLSLDSVLLYIYLSNSILVPFQS